VGTNDSEGSCQTVNSPPGVRSFTTLRYTQGIMPFALRASITVQFVPDKLVAEDDKNKKQYQALMALT
jgi:hypothetical protein